LDAICRKLPKLIKLHALSTAQFVVEVYPDNLSQILSTLSSDFSATDSDDIEFQFLHALIKGDDKPTPIDSSNSSNLLGSSPAAAAVLTNNHHWRYLTLMAHNHPQMVYHHLMTHDNYLPPKVLKLCQECDIPDACALLLEKMENVSAALQLLLQTLEGKLMTLKRVVRSISQPPSSSSSSTHHILSKSQRKRNDADKAKRHAEITAVKRTLSVTLDLCERNSQKSAGNDGDRHHSSQLWFNVLDRLINAKSFLRLSKELPHHSAPVETLLSELLQVTMQRMIGHVPLMDLVKKITTDHAGSRLGEFRDMMAKMLETFGFEVDVCESAAEVMHRDVRDMMEERRELKLRGSRVSTLHSIPLGSAELNQLLSSPSTTGGGSGTAIVSVSSTGHATIIPPFTTTRDEHKTKCQQAIDRLQSQRHCQRLAKRGKRSHCRDYAKGMVMMTLRDRQFLNSETQQPGVEEEEEKRMEEDASSSTKRYIGALSGAQHFGRFG